MTITKISMAQYQALPALSASGINTLVNQCPAKFWHESPWNPAPPADNEIHFDIGTALHLAVLEPEQLAARVVLIELASFRTKEARAQRDEAYIAGKTPLRIQDWQAVLGMERAIADRPDISALFKGGEAEATLTWNWFDVPCKARPDYLAPGKRDGYRIIVDAKTADSAQPDAVARKAFGEGWHIRDAWYREGATANSIIPERYVYVVVEKDPPHLIQAYEFDARAVEWGRTVIARGLKLFRECWERKTWPGYSDKTIAPLALPVWAEHQLADREQVAAVNERYLDA